MTVPNAICLFLAHLLGLIRSRIVVAGMGVVLGLVAGYLLSGWPLLGLFRAYIRHICFCLCLGAVYALPKFFLVC